MILLYNIRHENKTSDAELIKNCKCSLTIELIWILTLGGGMADTTDLDRLAKIIGLDEEIQMSPKVGNSLVKRNQIRWSPTIQVIPSQALIYKRRCRDLTVPICKMMKVKSRLQTEMVVKTIVVSKTVVGGSNLLISRSNWLIISILYFRF